MAAAGETTALTGKREYAHGLCTPTVPCLMTCCFCGCIPVYTTIQKAAPFQAIVLEVTKANALLFALLFWLGTIYGNQCVVVFTIAFVCFAVGLKNRLRIGEDDVMTLIKAVLCAPCLMGQLASTVDAMEAAGALVGAPVGVP